MKQLYFGFFSFPPFSLPLPLPPLSLSLSLSLSPYFPLSLSLSHQVSATFAASLSTDFIDQGKALIKKVGVTMYTGSTPVN